MAITPDSPTLTFLTFQVVLEREPQVLISHIDQSFDGWSK
jgi:hypothetical protein